MAPRTDCKLAAILAADVVGYSRLVGATKPDDRALEGALESRRILGRYALAARLANAELLEMPGLGNCPHIQDSDAFVAAVAPFLGLGAEGSERT